MDLAKVAMLKLSVVVLFGMLFLTGAVTTAQNLLTKDELAAIGQAESTNQTKLSHYTWQEIQFISVNEEAVDYRLYSVGIGANGQYQRNLVTEHTGQEAIASVDGDRHLESISWRDGDRGQIVPHHLRHLFVMTGASPRAGWLEGCLALDNKGFVLAGHDLDRATLEEKAWPLSRPPQLLETSLPGVFAVGDIRAGNVKRVASAVGEGSIAIHLVHQVLAEM